MSGPSAALTFRAEGSLWGRQQRPGSTHQMPVAPPRALLISKNVHRWHRCPLPANHHQVRSTQLCDRRGCPRSIPQVPLGPAGGTMGPQGPCLMQHSLSKHIRRNTGCPVPWAGVPALDTSPDLFVASPATFRSERSLLRRILFHGGPNEHQSGRSSSFRTPCPHSGPCSFGVL